MTASYDLPLIAALGLCAATWLLTRWWYGRQLKQSKRQRKHEPHPQFGEQQLEQARRQIEKLQADLIEARRAANSARLATQRARATHLSRPGAVPAQAAQASKERAASGAEAEPSRLAAAQAVAALDQADEEYAAPAHGFADTMPMKT